MELPKPEDILKCGDDLRDRVCPKTITETDVGTFYRTETVFPAMVAPY